MKKIVCSELVTFLVIVFYVIRDVCGENDFLKSTNIQSHSSSVLKSLNQDDFNYTTEAECQSKSRRKRFVAFPDGSSYNVTKQNALFVPKINF